MKSIPVEISRCPVCHKQACIDNNESRLTCSVCKADFDIHNGIPILLDKSKSPYLYKLYLEQKSDTWESIDTKEIGFSHFQLEDRNVFNKIVNFLIYPYRSVKFPPSFIDLHERYSSGGHVLSLGGGSTSPDLPGWINMDISSYTTVDCVGDACNLPFNDKTFSLIVSNSTLEHVELYRDVIDECQRVLKEDGYLYICVPQLAGRHHTRDFWRWTLPGLRYTLKKFEIIEEGVRVGPGMFAAHLLEAIVIGAFPRPKILCEILRSLMLWFALPLRYCDVLASSSEIFRHYAHTIYVIGRKTR